jgi:hypothetical protein
MLPNIENEPKFDSREKWLEAYIIELAKHSNQYQDPLQLPGASNRYHFLDSQRNFKRDINNKARPLDCLHFQKYRDSNLIK